LLKLVPLEVSIKGNEVSPEHSLQAPLKLVPLEVLINGNDVKDELLNQVAPK
tara:strand:+ start:484 stop:639 length:156 start_codon:yes stop_codon:yes gene_type:complete